MISNQQFTQATPELPLCSLRAATFVVSAVSVLTVTLALFTSTGLVAVIRFTTFHAFWLSPTALGVLWAVCSYRRRQAQLHAHNQQSPELEEAALQQLGAAIRPHFFFNALNAVMGLIRVNPRQAENVLQDTAELFRAVMNQHQQRLITLATELETCEQYVRIEQARLGNRLTLSWVIDKALLGVSVPPFSLQPLIENAIRHGIEPLAQGGKVNITVERLDEQLLLRVSNPIVSEIARYNAIKAKQHNGIALDNIAARLQLMYAQAAQFDHGVLEGRYEAQITLPLEFAS